LTSAVDKVHISTIVSLSRKSSQVVKRTDRVFSTNFGCMESEKRHNY